MEVVWNDDTGATGGGVSDDSRCVSTAVIT